MGNKIPETRKTAAQEQKPAFLIKHRQDRNFLRPSDDPNDWNNHSSLFGVLPPEISEEIFSLLETKHLAKLSRTCKKAREITYDHETFWDAFMDMGLKRYAVTDEVAVEVISMFAVKSNWNFASCEQLHNQTLIHLNTQCASVAILNIDSCRNITDEGIMAFTNKFATLTELNISRTQISAKGLRHIVQYAPKLKKLCLRSMGLGDITMLAELQHLVELDMGNPRFTSVPDNYSFKFPVIPSLKSLLIPKFISSQYDIRKALQEMPNLTQLDLSEIDERIFQPINHLPLRSLTLRLGYTMTGPDLKDTINALSPTLTYLDMSGGLGNLQWPKMILHAVESCPNLEKLIINECYSIAKKVPTIFDRIYEHPNLKYLEGGGYTFDCGASGDQLSLERLRNKPGGLKIITDGI